MTIQELVYQKTCRGECKCGKCCDKGNRPDPKSTHTIKMPFFVVSASDVSDTARKEFIDITRRTRGEFSDAKFTPLDGNAYDMVTLGGWIGDQGLAMQFMAYGLLLGVFKHVGPYVLANDEFRCQLSRG